ncbi:MAG: superoxide dismutase, Ni [Actinomycetota bacterium]|nr:superoxide dismutase, Ni [Actinomycetota bacterium]
MRLPRFLVPSVTASAHCDVPCGIYDPTAAQVAAKTVKAMYDKYAAVTGDDDKALNSRTRMILVKEEHAQKVKDELLILWTDYFKPNHEEAHPGLGLKIKTACNTASKAKQEFDPAHADTLVAQVDEIAEIFWATKKA